MEAPQLNTHSVFVATESHQPLVVSVGVEYFDPVSYLQSQLPVHAGESVQHWTCVASLAQFTDAKNVLFVGLRGVVYGLCLSS